MTSPSKKYATATHPTIEALIQGLYRYKDRAQALSRFTNIASHFVLSKEQPEATADSPAVLLWIKGFALTDKEIAEGYTGNFALMEVTTLDSGLHSLTAARVDKPLSAHPQKKRTPAKHPNWGHPIMRAVKKQRIYATVEQAEAELEQLHLEFPDVTIPGIGKLYLIIYEKREGNPRPTHKIALEITPHTSGGVTLVAHDNEKTAHAKTKKPLPTTPKNPTEAAGHFAAKVLLRKKTRRKNLGRPVTGLKPTE